MAEHDHELDQPPINLDFKSPLPQPDIKTSAEFERTDVEPEVLTLPDITDQSVIDVSEGSQEVLLNSEISQSQEKTRAKIALTFTQIFLFLVVASFLLPGTIFVVRPELIPDPVETTKDLATTVASILAGPFGFIVGFYFKKDSGE